jgi:hypothetical protein
MRPIRFSLLTVGLVGTLLVAACTADEPQTGADHRALGRIVDAAVATRAAGTARTDQTIVMDFPEQAEEAPGGRVTVEAAGVLDLGDGRGRLSVTTEGAGLAGADALGGNMEMILDGRSMYMNSPFYQQLAPDHEPWLRVSYDELEARGLSQLGQQDPLAFVEALRAVSSDVEEMGAEEVRGVAATRYRATLDLTRLASELPARSREAIEATFRQLAIERIPVDVWIDEEDRVRRLVSEVGLGKDAAAAGRMELRLELFDFGVAFDLEVPPEGQVAEFSEVFGSPGG